MAKVLCKCECGDVREYIAADITRGHSKSCGCLQRDVVRKAMTTHGASVGYKCTPEYKIWCSAKSRCTNPSDSRYRDYGGRGLKMCDAWTESFASFYSDMGARPSKMHSLDRINNELGYGPENCRWATTVDQANNTRSNRIIELDGKSHTLSEWSRITGMSRGLISARIANGWTVREAIATPVSRSNKIVTLRRTKSAIL